jgi:hypothetical protein
LTTFDNLVEGSALGRARDRPGSVPGMLSDRFRLADRVAVVTGAGRGIGAASTLAFAESGAAVVIAQPASLDGNMSRHTTPVRKR